ncbi:cyclin-dependent kinase inhibitor 1Ba [Melanotaenia boesemani]|uniref:cyclin-dependent kinase inhibitor 1Ba n=1 Tax=Melanotaenia boesemani TaxID=1250792 RepID=UPI001C0460E8|nr:cyclin-dependent kinase inhibitor 1Ba [Melanotaenia boesemani]
MKRAEYACIIPVTLHLKGILLGNSCLKRFGPCLCGLYFSCHMCSKMSDVRLSNASPTVERVDSRQQDSVRTVRRVLFGTPDREETRRCTEAVMQQSKQDFMEKYNFDPETGIPLSPGNYKWEEDSEAPEYYRRPPHTNQRPQREADSPNGNHRQEDEERNRTQTAHLPDRNGSRKRRSEASGSCSNECPGKRSPPDEDDDEDQSNGAGSQSRSAAGERPSRPENNVEVH